MLEFQDFEIKYTKYGSYLTDFAQNCLRYHKHTTKIRFWYQFKLPYKSWRRQSGYCFLSPPAIVLPWGRVLGIGSKYRKYRVFLTVLGLLLSKILFLISRYLRTYI